MNSPTVESLPPALNTLHLTESSPVTEPETRLSHIFPENVRPPVAIFKPSEPDVRLSNTQQLASCLGHLRYSYEHDKDLDHVVRNWLQITKSDPGEQERLSTLASDVIETFKRDELKNAMTVAEVVQLLPALEKDEFQELVKEFYSVIERSASPDAHQLEGLAQLIQGAEPGHLEADNLIKILQLLNTRLANTHHQSPHLTYKLTLTISHVLDAMADVKVNDLDHETLREPLSAYLVGLKTSADPYLVYQAAYAYQALQWVPGKRYTVVRSIVK
jgi:hypothetical protein